MESLKKCKRERSYWARRRLLWGFVSLFRIGCRGFIYKGMLTSPKVAKQGRVPGPQPQEDVMSDQDEREQRMFELASGALPHVSCRAQTAYIGNIEINCLVDTCQHMVKTQIQCRGYILLWRVRPSGGIWVQ